MVEKPEERRARKRLVKEEAHKAKIEAEVEQYKPGEDPQIGSGDPYKTLFVARMAYETTETTLMQAFEQFGPIKSCKVVRDTKTGKPRGYGFIEFEHERDMKTAYKQGDGRKIDGRRVLVDVERGRTVLKWRPRRLGGGLGSMRVGGKPGVPQARIHTGPSMVGSGSNVGSWNSSAARPAASGGPPTFTWSTVTKDDERGHRGGGGGGGYGGSGGGGGYLGDRQRDRGGLGYGDRGGDRDRGGTAAGGATAVTTIDAATTMTIDAATTMTIDAATTMTIDAATIIVAAAKIAVATTISATAAPSRIASESESESESARGRGIATAIDGLATERSRQGSPAMGAILADRSSRNERLAPVAMPKLLTCGVVISAHR